MLTTEEITKTISEIAQKYGIKRVKLFGSRATNNYREDSDVDLIVEFETRAISLFILGDLMNELEDALDKGLPLLSNLAIVKKDTVLNILDKLDMLFNLSNVFTYHLSNYIFAEFHGFSHCP